MGNGCLAKCKLYCMVLQIDRVELTGPGSLFFPFFQEDRHCGPASIANHISSLVYPIKFLHVEDAPNFLNVPIIRQLRAQATILQREGDLKRPSTREDLESQNRWLPW